MYNFTDTPQINNRKIGKVNRLHNYRIEPFPALFWALGIVLTLIMQQVTHPAVLASLNRGTGTCMAGVSQVQFDGRSIAPNPFPFLLYLFYETHCTIHVYCIEHEHYAKCRYALENQIIIRFTPQQTKTLPKWMFLQKLSLESSLLLCGQCGILPVLQTAATTFAFSSVFFFFYMHYTYSTYTQCTLYSIIQLLAFVTEYVIHLYKVNFAVSGKKSKNNLLS